MKVTLFYQCDSLVRDLYAAELWTGQANLVDPCESLRKWSQSRSLGKSGQGTQARGGRAKGEGEGVNL